MDTLVVVTDLKKDGSPIAVAKYLYERRQHQDCFLDRRRINGVG